MTGIRLAAWAPALALVVTLASSAGASGSAVTAQARASAVAVRIAVGTSTLAATEGVSAPSDAVAFGAAFTHPADGSSVSTGPVTASALSSSGDRGVGEASSEVANVSLFTGEVTAERVAVRAKASAGPRDSSGGTGGSVVQGLVVLGQPVAARANASVPLADWGDLEILVTASERKRADGRRSQQAEVTGLAVTLRRDHGGLPAGSRVTVAHAEAFAQADVPVETPRRDTRPPPPAPQRTPAPQPSGRRSESPRPPARRLKPPEPTRSPIGVPPVQRSRPATVTPPLLGGPYVFPVYGPSSFTDTFGAPRASVGWHHGEDIFAPLGAPVVAVADGEVFSVGWNDIGGNRFWLRDRQGNQFYYAHLSGFAPLAVNGARVRAGEVLGFVGDTGDAAGTPYHLHFEIHPVSLLGRGYDGAVRPAAYLHTWPHVESLRLSQAAAAAQGVARGVSARVPQPGAILLHVSDISRASGLDPASFRQALADRALREGDGGFLARAGSATGWRPPATGTKRG